MMTTVLISIGPCYDMCVEVYTIAQSDLPNFIALVRNMTTDVQLLASFEITEGGTAVEYLTQDEAWAAKQEYEFVRWVSIGNGPLPQVLQENEGARVYLKKLTTQCLEPTPHNRNWPCEDQKARIRQLHEKL